MLPNCCMHYAVISDVERTRNVPYFKKLRCATDIRKKSISVHGPSLWNSLPLMLQNISSISAFKRSVTLHIFDSYV